MLTIDADFVPSASAPSVPRIRGHPITHPLYRKSQGVFKVQQRIPLWTPDPNSYRFTFRRSVSYNPDIPSPCPSDPHSDGQSHPLQKNTTLGTAKAKHHPIVISQEIIDRVLKQEGPLTAEKKHGKLGFPIPLKRQSEQQISLAQALEERSPRPRHIPIVIPDFSQPPKEFLQSSLTSSPSSSNTFRLSQRSLDSPLLTPVDSDCGISCISDFVPRGCLDHPPTSPCGMTRPDTAHSMATDVTGGANANSFDSSFPQGYAELSGSQYSFSSDVAQEDPSAVQKPHPSPPPSARTITSPTTEPRTPTASSGNLSGLVCNVHKCTGKEPRGLVGATTTILGDKLYVFGGRSLSRRRPHMTADLYELDLIHRHWSKIRTKGQVPSPRYFHSVCALGDSKLICYGGMSPAPPNSNGPLQTPSSDQPDVVVMSDVHIYDTKTRTWTRIDTQDTPQGRYAHCAAVLPSTGVFSSPNAPLAAIHHNPSEGDNPNSGQLGLALDGSGGAEMVVVGGQDNANHYIEQVSVFNLRSLRWTATNSLGRSCGAYRSAVAPLVGFPASRIGAGVEATKNVEKDGRSAVDANSMLIYSNYNFLDVRLELQVRTQDGRLEEKPMGGSISPPGLRFPNGGVLNNHFVISGTYLTSSRQEYALWALDLRTMTWSRIDVGGSVFGNGSWNRGVLWPRRNTFVILGSRKRNLVEDYNHRRINFTNVCLVELEAFGLYDNPRHAGPTSSYSSYSAPELPPALRPKNTLWSGGGRPHFTAAEELGKLTLGMKEIADMDIVTINGERIPANSHMLARRWGAYFVSVLREGANTTAAQASLARDFNGMSLGVGEEDRDGSTIRPAAQYRNSSVTITPSLATSAYTSGSTLTAGSNNSAGTATLSGSVGHAPSASTSSAANGLMTNGHIPPDLANGDSAADASGVKPFHAPSPASLPASTRSRTLYLPHTAPTVNALLHFLYTSALPPAGHILSTPQILCSLLQLARPYRIDGLLEAVVQRLHQSMDGRSAAAVFNACAMAAGGGRGTGFEKFSSGTVLVSEADLDEAIGGADEYGRPTRGPEGRSRMTSRVRGANERKNAFAAGGADSTDASEDETSGTDTEAGSVTDGSEVWEDGGPGASGPGGAGPHDEEIWTGERSCVIGLQKRGLRGLMEGRRARERGESSSEQRR